MKVWITKYALTSGIEEIDSKNVKSFSINGTYLHFRRTGNNYCLEVYSKNEWCNRKESAIAKAEEMRKKKIASLKKQIEKLEKMKFE